MTLNANWCQNDKNTGSNYRDLLFFFSFLQSNTAVEDRSLGKFLRWLINEQNGTFFGMKLPTGFQLIGQTTLQQYRAWLDYFDRQSKLENRSFVTRTTKRAYARIGVCFLTAIWHRGLRNGFFFVIFHLLSIFYLNFYIPFPFGLLNLFSI